MKKQMGVCVVLAGICMFAPAVFAEMEGFENADGTYDYFSNTNSSIGVTTEQVYDGNQSLKMTIGASNEYARVHLTLNSPVKLADVYGEWKSYVNSTNNNTNLKPYMMFAIDADNSGTYNYGATGDALAIQWVSGATNSTVDSWFTDSVDLSTTVHVVGNRTGLTAGTFDASGTQDTLGALAATTFSGSTTWGDLNIIAYRMAAGLWPNSGENTMYVDNATIVPEPASLSLLAIGGLALLRRRH